MTLPVTIIGGYLGSGKTTLLNRVLSGDHGQRVAVLVNDFGELNVDASLIVEHEGDTVSLANGCACCSASDGTADALARFVRRRQDFDRIVIEMSGVADPGRLAQIVSAFHLPVDGIIVLADAELLFEQLANCFVGRAVARSLTQADLIVLNKLDRATPDTLAGIQAEIDRIAPGVPRIGSINADIPVHVLFGLDRSERDLQIGDGNHASGYVSWTWTRLLPLSLSDVETLAAKLVATALRAKGHVALIDSPNMRHLYQQVGPRWTLIPDGSWGESGAVTRIVAIGLRSATSPTETGAGGLPE